MGTTMRLPRTTELPLWFHRVICAEMIGSWSIRASICAGPNTVVSAGNWYTRTTPRLGWSLRAATQAIMFGRLAAIIGWRRRNSAFGSPGIRMIT